MRRRTENKPRKRMSAEDRRKAILEGKYDPDKVCLAITQTGGMCRATNYFGLIRKALIDAGYPQIPVIAISTQGLEDNQIGRAHV